jgi:hypothetical protein
VQAIAAPAHPRVETARGGSRHVISTYLKVKV